MGLFGPWCSGPKALPDRLCRGPQHRSERTYRAGISQSRTANFQKLQIALLIIIISWAVLVMMCGHEKNQQAPCLEVVDPYGEYCLIRQLVVLLRQLGETRYLRSDNFSSGSKINKRFSQSRAPQAGLSSLRVWRHVDKMPDLYSCSWSPRKGAHLTGPDL